MWQKFNALFIYTKSHIRPSSNKSREMDIEQFYVEKRDNFVCFISELRAELSKLDFLAPCQCLVKNDKGQQKRMFNSACLSRLLSCTHQEAQDKFLIPLAIEEAIPCHTGASGCLLKLHTESHKNWYATKQDCFMIVHKMKAAPSALAPPTAFHSTLWPSFPHIHHPHEHSVDPTGWQ